MNRSVPCGVHARSRTRKGPEMRTSRPGRALAAIIVSIAAVSGLQVATASSASADGDFGSNPFAAVQKAASRVVANNSLNTCGMNAAQLTAAMIAPTYNESGNSVQTFAPSPGALGRADFRRPNLYVSKAAFDHSDDARRRVDWMPGTGLWQADDGGFGAPYATEKLTATGLATVIATFQVQAYCQSGGSVAAMMPSGMWAGCGESLHASASDGNDCVYYYNQLYDPSTASLRTINKPAMSAARARRSASARLGAPRMLRPSTAISSLPGRLPQSTVPQLTVARTQPPISLLVRRSTSGVCITARATWKCGTGPHPRPAARRTSRAAPTPTTQETQDC